MGIVLRKSLQVLAHFKNFKFQSNDCQTQLTRINSFFSLNGLLSMQSLQRRGPPEHRALQGEPVLNPGSATYCAARRHLPNFNVLCLLIHRVAVGSQVVAGVKVKRSTAPGHHIRCTSGCKYERNYNSIWG